MRRYRSFELLEDGTKCGQRQAGPYPVIFMFGGVGAVVSGTGDKQAHQKYKSLHQITVSNMVSPVVYISLIGTETARQRNLQKGISRIAGRSLSLLQVICSGAGRPQHVFRGR